MSSAEHLRRSVEAFQTKDFLLRAAGELRAAHRQIPSPFCFSISAKRIVGRDARARR